MNVTLNSDITNIFIMKDDWIDKIVCDRFVLFFVRFCNLSRFPTLLRAI